jgi:OOP family OmpA-OmpF porin
MGLLRTALPYFGIVIALAANSALAQQRTGIPTGSVWYAGAGAGVGYYDAKASDFAIPSLSTQGLSDTTAGWQVFGGYRFNPYLGAEISWTDLGKASGPSSFAAHSFNVSGVGRIPFGSGFFLQGKVGAAFLRVAGFGNDVYNTNLLLGLGAGWDFPNGVTLLAEGEYFGEAGDAASTGRANLYLLTFNAMIRF